MKAVYRVEPQGSGWMVLHDQEQAGPYATKEAAFEAAVATVERAIGEGYEVELRVAGGVGGVIA